MALVSRGPGTHVSLCHGTAIFLERQQPQSGIFKKKLEVERPAILCPLIMLGLG